MSIQDEPRGATLPTDKLQQAGQGVSTVATSAKETAKETASEVAFQAKSVASETKNQVTRLARQAADELREQADGRSAQASRGLRTLSTQIDALASGRPHEAGSLLDYLKDGQSRISSLADRLEQRGAQGVLDDVATFARRRPGLFLLCAAGAGLAVGRMVRANAAGSPSSDTARGSAGLYGSYDRAGVYASGQAPVTPPMVDAGLGEPGPTARGVSDGISGIERTGSW